MTEILPNALKQVADKASAALLDALAKYRYPRSDNSNLSLGEIEAAEARSASWKCAAASAGAPAPSAPAPKAPAALGDYQGSVRYRRPYTSCQT